jgi:hypothetical protein
MVPCSLVDIYRRFGNHYLYLRFEVLTAMVMKSNVAWDIMLYSQLKVNRRFGGTYRRYLTATFFSFQGTAGQESQAATSKNNFFCSLLVYLFGWLLHSEDGGIPLFDTLINLYQTRWRDMTKSLWSLWRMQ